MLKWIRSIIEKLDRKQLPKSKERQIAPLPYMEELWDYDIHNGTWKKGEGVKFKNGVGQKFIDYKREVDHVYIVAKSKGKAQQKLMAAAREHAANNPDKFK